MNPAVNPILEQLHDIEGLDAISPWPLALGWWVVIAVAVMGLIALTMAIVLKLKFMRSWKNDTLKKLAALEKNLSSENAKASVILLSEYLRRVALKRYSRKECAGLTGERWLKWLAQKDPKQFDWEKRGALLAEMPYAPATFSGKNLPLNEIKDLIQAAKVWVVQEWVVHDGGANV